MATKTDKLVIELTTDGAGNVRASLGGVEKELSKVGDRTKKTSSDLISFKQILGGISFAVITRGLIDANVEYQKLSASLKTVTGSQEAANVAFAGLEKFAATTPYQLENVVGSFIKLKSLGLDPSIDALTSYGNTAAAMGKDLDQLIEAVADAATGEFERLKEFGIKTRQQGDQVSFTFRGVTTTVKKDAAEIESYLQKIGDTTFASGMQDQMQTLGGVFSNFQDSLGGLARAIGDAGLNDLVADLARGLTDLSAEITKFVNNPASMPEWMKVSAFSVKALSAEFLDLGDLIGATAAILDVEVGPGMFDKIDTIIKDREAKRAQLEQDMVAFAAKLEGIGSGATAAALSTAAAGGVPDPFAKGDRAATAKAVTAAYDDMDRALDLVIAQFEDLDKATAENIAGLAKQNALQAEGVRVYDDTRTATEQLAAELERLDELYAQGAITFDTYSRAVFDTQDAYKQVEKTGVDTMASLEAAARGWGEQFTNAMADMVQSGKLSFSDLADSIISDLLRIMIYQNITAPILRGLNFLPPVPTSTGHTGGIVGGLTGSTFVNPGVFAGAQRYHTGGMVGLGPNEVPIIANRGEEVLTRNDPRHAMNQGGSGSVKVEIIKNGSPIETDSSSARFDPDGMVVSVILKDFERGGPISQRIGSKR
jgi:hypothetical protein